MQQVDLYCKKCKKAMKMSYMVSGDKDAPVLTGITIRCHTNKCTRVVMLKTFTEGCLIEQAKTLVALRYIEKEVRRDMEDGLDSAHADKITEVTED